jgi:nucleotide-binding universal stress UspA family protein
MRLLIGYDGSEYADAAIADLDRAGLPVACDATILTAADVFEPPSSPGTLIEPALEQAARLWRSRVATAIADANVLAQTAVSRLREKFPQWTITTQGAADSPAWAIIKHAEGLYGQSKPADLIVLGAAGRSSIGRALFGSVALKVLHNARRSVRIGRMSSSKRPLEPVHLVVGVDRSDDSTAAVRAICARKWPPKTECRVVTVFDTQLFTAMVGIDPIFVSSHDNWPQRYADQAAELLRNAGLAATAMVREGPVAPCLIHEAEAFGADCIFVGARGLRRTERFLLGSVSASVAMHAPCTVEVIRS